MSYVTNVILTMGILEDEDARIAEVNSALPYGFKENLVGCSSMPERDAGRYIGGEKCLEATVYVAAFNYLCLDDLLQHLHQGVRWEYPECVGLFVNGPEEDHFHEVFVQKELDQRGILLAQLEQVKFERDAALAELALARQTRDAAQAASTQAVLDRRAAQQELDRLKADREPCPQCGALPTMACPNCEVGG